MDEIDQTILGELPSEPFAALEKLCGNFRVEDLYVNYPDVDRVKARRQCADRIRRYIIASQLLLRRLNIFVPRQPPIYTNTDISFASEADEYFTQVESALIEERMNREFVKLDNSNLDHLVSLLPSEVEKIQNAIDALRVTIQSAEYLNEGHKRRLLLRLEKMQVELHKTISDPDAFWGGVVDAASALGAAGEEAKPLVDRFREIAEVIWRKHSRSDELSGADELFKLPGAESND